jgi:hypothetical protein
MTLRKVLLVGWDAADWKVIQPLMAEGKMPNVQRLVSSGASGQITTLHPPLSPMLGLPLPPESGRSNMAFTGSPNRRRTATESGPSRIFREIVKRCGTFSARTICAVS